jgi:hypothetical protein
LAQEGSLIMLWTLVLFSPSYQPHVPDVGPRCTHVAVTLLWLYHCRDCRSGLRLSVPVELGTFHRRISPTCFPYLAACPDVQQSQPKCVHSRSVFGINLQSGLSVFYHTRSSIAVSFLDSIYHRSTDVGIHVFES